MPLRSEKQPVGGINIHLPQVLFNDRDAIYVSWLEPIDFMVLTTLLFPA